MKLSIAAVLVFAACTIQATAEDFDPQSEMFIGNLFSPLLVFPKVCLKAFQKLW